MGGARGVGHLHRRGGDGLQQRVEGVGLAPELPAFAGAQLELQRAAIAGGGQTQGVDATGAEGLGERAEPVALHRLEAAPPGVEVELLCGLAQLVEDDQRVLRKRCSGIRRTERHPGSAREADADRIARLDLAGGRPRRRIERARAPQPDAVDRAAAGLLAGAAARMVVQHDLRFVHGALPQPGIFAFGQEVLDRAPGHVVERVERDRGRAVQAQVPARGRAGFEAAEVGEDRVELGDQLGALRRVQLFVRKSLQQQVFAGERQVHRIRAQPVPAGLGRRRIGLAQAAQGRHRQGVAVHAEQARELAIVRLEGGQLPAAAAEQGRETLERESGGRPEQGCDRP